jgi:predicted Fe-Mo cluster-binding NifX family protein
MKIAISSKDFKTISGHAGQARRWLVYELAEHARTKPLPVARQLELKKEEVIHHFEGETPHPLDEASLIITASAGDGFLRRMAARGIDVVRTGETDPACAIAHLLAGRDQPTPGFDITTSLCKVFDLFSKH